MNDQSTRINTSMAKSEYLHQRIDSDLKQAAIIVAEKRYGNNSLTTLITAMLLADPAIREEFNHQKDLDTFAKSMREKDNL